MKFSERLRRLGFSSYADYLASDGWKQFKRRYVASGGRRVCLICGSKPVQLHHKTYERLGSELFADVVPLCRSHHEAVHEWLKTSGRVFVEFTHEAIEALGGAAQARPKAKRKGNRRGSVDAATAERRQKKHLEAKEAASKSLGLHRQGMPVYKMLMPEPARFVAYKKKFRPQPRPKNPTKKEVQVAKIKQWIASGVSDPRIPSGYKPEVGDPLLGARYTILFDAEFRMRRGRR